MTEFRADRHADLDAGEGGGAMTDADYYDRVGERGGAGHEWMRDPEQRGEGLMCRNCGITEAEAEASADGERCGR